MMRKSLKSKITLGVLALCILALIPVASQAQKKARVFAPEKGKFTTQLDGKPVGHEEFEISPSSVGWPAQGATDLKAPDSPATHVTGALTLQPDGAPISSEGSSQAKKTNGAHIASAQAAAKIPVLLQRARPHAQHQT